MIPFLMVVIAYGLGHVGGYRMCKVRVRHLLRAHITRVSKAPLGHLVMDTYTGMLNEVNRL